MSHMNGLQTFERTTEQVIEAITLSSKTITAAAMTTNYKLTMDATLPITSWIQNKLGQQNFQAWVVMH